MGIKGRTTAWKKYPPQSIDKDMVQDQPSKIDACSPMINRHHLNMMMNGCKDSTPMMIVPSEVGERHHTLDLDMDDARAETL